MSPARELLGRWVEPVGGDGLVVATPASSSVATAPRARRPPRCAAVGAAECLVVTRGGDSSFWWVGENHEVAGSAAVRLVWPGLRQSGLEEEGQRVGAHCQSWGRRGSRLRFRAPGVNWEVGRASGEERRGWGSAFIAGQRCHGRKPPCRRGRARGGELGAALAIGECMEVTRASRRDGMGLGHWRGRRQRRQQRRTVQSAVALGRVCRRAWPKGEMVLEGARVRWGGGRHAWTMGSGRSWAGRSDPVGRARSWHASGVVTAWHGMPRTRRPGTPCLWCQPDTQEMGHALGLVKSRLNWGWKLWKGYWKQVFEVICEKLARWNKLDFAGC